MTVKDNDKLGSKKYHEIILSWMYTCLHHVAIYHVNYTSQTDSYGNNHCQSTSTIFYQYLQKLCSVLVWISIRGVKSICANTYWSVMIMITQIRSNPSLIFIFPNCQIVLLLCVCSGDTLDNRHYFQYYFQDL